VREIGIHHDSSFGKYYTKTSQTLVTPKEVGSISTLKASDEIKLTYAKDLPGKPNPYDSFFESNLLVGPKRIFASITKIIS
jgi:hypothetical protein